VPAVSPVPDGVLTRCPPGIWVLELLIVTFIHVVNFPSTADNFVGVARRLNRLANYSVAPEPEWAAVAREFDQGRPTGLRDLDADI
jgi:hypothetical protein